MAGKVLRRVSVVVNPGGVIECHDRQETWAVADKLAGVRLDRRQVYCIIAGQVCESTSWTSECSGCNGGGCHECGYQGKVRNGMWVPRSALQSER